MGACEGGLYIGNLRLLRVRCPRSEACVRPVGLNRGRCGLGNALSESVGFSGVAEVVWYSVRSGKLVDTV